MPEFVMGAERPLTLDDYMVLDGPPPVGHIAYGNAPSQYVEVFVPPGDGPFPVVVLIHGGCWLSELGGMRQMRDMAAALVAQNIAVWSVEYRRIDEEGGGYPGTYQDVIAALELLESNAHAYRLDLDHLVAVGHSAGAFLARWSAGRGRLSTNSPLYRARPLAVREVVALGSVGDDLRHERDHLAGVCGVDVTRLTGTTVPGREDVYADTSPSELIPSGSHTVFINGDLDTIAPPASAVRSAQLARARGERAETIVLPNASHFDEVATSSKAWALILSAIQGALARTGNE